MLIVKITYQLRKEITMRICFCDDEKSFHAVVENMIQKWSGQKGVLCEVFHYDSAEQMLFENEQKFSFDLILRCV